MEKKMPLPSFSETFNMPSKILARFKDSPNIDHDDLSNSDIFPNNCSCCWATEYFNSRVPSPIWNDTNFRIVSELAGLTSRVPEYSFTNNSLECQQYKEFEETDTEKIENVRTVGTFQQICPINSKEESPSRCYKQVDVIETRDSCMSKNCCSVITSERLCENHSESSRNSRGCDCMPSIFQLCGVTKKKECAVEVSDSGISGDKHPFSGNSSDSGDEMVNPNEQEKPKCDENAPLAGENMISSLLKRCRRDINELDLLNYSNQENKEDVSSDAESLKNDNQLLSECRIKKGRKAEEKQIADYISDQSTSIINRFSCDKCQRSYKSKKTLRWHRNKNPDCKPPLSIIMKNKSSIKYSVHSITLENININRKSEKNTMDLAANMKVTTQEENLKKNSTSMVKRIEEAKEEDVQPNVGYQFCSFLNEKLGMEVKNSCKEFKISADSIDAGKKNLFWQCEFCVKCYKHKSSLQKHVKKSHPLK